MYLLRLGVQSLGADATPSSVVLLNGTPLLLFRFRRRKEVFRLFTVSPVPSQIFPVFFCSLSNALRPYSTPSPSSPQPSSTLLGENTP